MNNYSDILDARSKEFPPISGALGVKGSGIWGYFTLVLYLLGIFRYFSAGEHKQRFSCPQPAQRTGECLFQWRYNGVIKKIHKHFNVYRKI